MPNSSINLDQLGSVLNANGLLIYCGLILLFAALQLLLVKQESTIPSGGLHAFTNFALLGAGLALMALLPLGIATAAIVSMDNGWGLFQLVDAHWSIVLTAAIIGTTFSTYWLHRALHAVPLFWKLHRIHHSDVAPDLTTGFRHHPGEHLIIAPMHFAVIVALGLPLWAALLAHCLLLAGSLFKHLDSDLPDWLEKRVGLVIATPSLHRFHHSSYHKETDSNFGNLLIIWDRLFGTFTPHRPGGPERKGLGERYDRGSDNLLAQLALGFRDPPKLDQEISPSVGENS